MYKIYINETPLILASENEVKTGQQMPVEGCLVARYPGKAKFLMNYIDMLEKSRRYEAVVLYANDPEQLRRDFESQFSILEAAGGLVFNASEELLFIFRRGYWDLPKGKIDKGESREEAAVREVQEETGLQTLELGAACATTHHTYRDGKGRRILKHTYWFRMQTDGGVLTPQAEEDIELAVWMSLEEFFDEERPIYSSISEMLKKFL